MCMCTWLTTEFFLCLLSMTRSRLYVFPASSGSHARDVVSYGWLFKMTPGNSVKVCLKNPAVLFGRVQRSGIFSEYFLPAWSNHGSNNWTIERLSRLQINWLISDYSCRPIGDLIFQTIRTNRSQTTTRRRVNLNISTYDWILSIVPLK